jgi:hypothetical protein
MSWQILAVLTGVEKWVLRRLRLPMDQASAQAECPAGYVARHRPCLAELDDPGSR